MLQYSGFRFPPNIIAHAVYLYHQYALSFREVEEILAYRGIEVSYEESTVSIYPWCGE